MGEKRVFEAREVDSTYYWDRVDRNIGIISRREQEILRESAIGIAGCGGMGGLVAAQFARIGVGHLKIADSETFDRSNINRQFGARLDTLGESKALVTAEEIQRITPDVQIDVYEDGINEDTVEDFVKGCSVICDEIEFFALKYRIMLHKVARRYGVTIFNGNVVGFGTRVLCFTPQSMTIEDFLGLTGEEDPMEPWVIRRIAERFCPEVPGGESKASQEVLDSRLVKQKRAPIFGGTPPLSTGVLVDRVSLFILDATKNRPWVASIPEMPGYFLFDAGQWRVKVHKGKWW